MHELGSLDFETYSAAGQIWNEATRKWTPPKGAKKRGLGVVGTRVYFEHPSAEVLTLSYRCPGETQKHRWKPGDAPPQRLFAALMAGGVFKAHNAFFEFSAWELLCTLKYGWPSIMPWRYQLRCTMATARVNSLPGGLADLSTVLHLPTPKDADGKRLLDKFSVPRNPTKADPRWKITPVDDPADFARLEAYCDTDLDAEEGAFQRMIPMTAAELLFWWIDQEINWRGIAIDRAGVRDCIAVLEQALEHYGAEFRALTNGLEPTQLQATAGWLAAQGIHMPSMDEEALDESLENLPPHPPGGCWAPRRVLEIRQLIGSASVKKLYQIENTAGREDRLYNLIIHHGARTGRPTGEGAQPLNMPRAGPDLRYCAPCGQPYRPDHTGCPWCAAPVSESRKGKWSHAAVEPVLEAMRTRSLEVIEWYFGDALSCIAGCIRGLFIAGPGMQLIASDYSAIETVVTAALAGEQWRLDVIASGVDIYLASASTITGTPLSEYAAYQETHKEHHPHRQKIGKINELANGFGGWIGASKAFGSKEPDDVIKAQILAWRAASPAIVEMWGGQFRGSPWDPNARQEYYGFEGCAIQAILYPGVTFDYRGIKFTVRPHPAGWDALFITLLSGRELTYHRPQLSQSTREYAHPGEYAITYWTWNSNPKYGAFGWVPMSTFGGRLTENVVQATAHDIQRFGIINLRAAGYPMVLGVYDEDVCEIPLGTGSLEEFERIMATMPPYAATWPIKAAGGWIGQRYRKG